jgi:hypothetical protein
MFIANVNAARRGVTLARQSANPTLVEGSNADFVHCAPLVVNSRLSAAALARNRILIASCS